MIGVTRAGGNVDRVACPWLIRRSIDAHAQFLFVPAADVLASAHRIGGRSYDAEGAEFTHRETPEGDHHQKLAWEFPRYDALYAECQRRIARRET